MRQSTVKALEQAEEKFLIDAATAADDATFKEKMALANRCAAVIEKEETKKQRKKDRADEAKMNERKLANEEEKTKIAEGQLRLEQDKLANEKNEQKATKKHEKLITVVEVGGKVLLGVLTGGITLWMFKKSLVAEYKDRMIVPSSAKEAKNFLKGLK